jgi:DNA-binding NtrC family response regulator
MMPMSSSSDQDSTLKPVVLLVDDEPLLLEATADLLRSIGYEVLTADSTFSAIQILRAASEIACVVADQKLPGHSGLVLLDHVAKAHPAAGRIIWTGAVGPEVALAAWRHTVIVKDAYPRLLVDAIANEIKTRSRVVPG